MSSLSGIDFIVNKRAWNDTRFVPQTLSTDLAPGQVLFRVDRFALTANNISYAAAGELLGYWRFFPTESDGWGRIPAMGFGDVIASTHDGVPVGTRCFGFYPMSKHLLIEPASASASSVVDGVAHRQGLAAVYNQYSPVQSDALYDADKEDELILMRGLFMTSFLAEDFLGDSDLYGARSVLISSASSKTSIALAFMLARRGQARSVGITSASHLAFVTGLGLYDEVVTYDQIGGLSPDVPTVFVDMAGNSKVSRTIHEHFGAQLKFSQRIGGTHWDAGGDDDGIPGPAREFFFAPSQIQKRIADWGPGGFQQRLGDSWRAFRDDSSRWLKVERASGPEALAGAYRATLEGSVSPDRGLVLSLWEDESAATGAPEEP